MDHMPASDRAYETAASFLGVMANTKRLAIMHLLVERQAELSVGAIAEHVHLSQSALSQHLAKMRAADLVQTRRDRQTIYYRAKQTLKVAQVLRVVDVNA